MQKIIFAIGATVLLSTTYTMAQQGPIARECAADIRAACGDVAPGGIRACLNSHLADLTRRAKPYCSERQHLRTNAEVTSVHCAHA